MSSLHGTDVGDHTGRLLVERDAREESAYHEPDESEDNGYILELGESERKGND